MDKREGEGAQAQTCFGDGEAGKRGQEKGAGRSGGTGGAGKPAGGDRNRGSAGG